MTPWGAGRGQGLIVAIFGDVCPSLNVFSCCTSCGCAHVEEAYRQVSSSAGFAAIG